MARDSIRTGKRQSAGKGVRGRKAAPRKALTPRGSASDGTRQQLAEARKQQSATAEILKVISASRADVQPVFEAIARSARTLCGSTFAYVFRYDGKLMHYAAGAHLTAKQLRLVNRNFPQPPRNSLMAGRAILMKAPVSTEDAFADRGYDQSVAKVERYRRLFAAPMLLDGEPIGALAVGWDEPGPVAKAQQDLLTTFAHQAVIAIENARLFNEASEARKEALEKQAATAEILRAISRSPGDVQPVFETIMKNAVRLCNAPIGIVTRFDGDMLHLVADHDLNPVALELQRRLYPMRPDRSQASGRALLSRSIVRIEDVHKDKEYDKQLAKVGAWRKLLAVPMLRGDEPLGVITLAWADPGPVPKVQEELLQTFADQAVIAIENVRLFNETKEALERQTASAEILKVIASSPSDVQPVFDAIAESGLRLLAGHGAVVTRVIGDMLHLAALTSTTDSGNDAVRSMYPMPLSSPNVVSKAARSAAPAFTSDIENDPKISEAGKEIARLRGVRSNVAVPMLRKGVCIGTISVARREPGPFSNHQIGMLQTFADQAVIAIENVRMFREIEERNADLRQALEFQTASGEILASISSSMADSQPVFDAIVKSTRQLFDTNYAVVSLIRDNRLELVAASGGETYLKHVRTAYPWPLAGNDGIAAGRAFGKGQVIQICPIVGNPDAPARMQRLAEASGYNATLLAPMMREGAAIGLLVTSRSQAIRFDEKEVALIKVFADQAVIAIENARLFNATKEALERQTATAEILKVIASSPADVQPVFDAIANSAYRLIGGFSTAVARVFDEVLHLVAFSSTGEAGNEALKTAFPMPVARSKAARTGQPVCVSDTEALPESAASLRELARVRGFRSIVIVPMLKNGVATGTISVTRREPGEFTEHQVDLLKTFADQAVIAVENVRLFNETKEALERQTATAEILASMSGSMTDTKPVFDAIVGNVLRLFGTGYAMVQLVRDGMLEVAAIKGEPQFESVARNYPLPLDEHTIGGKAILTQQVVHLAPVVGNPAAPRLARKLARDYGFNSALIAPMIREGKAIGAIGTARRDAVPFDERQVALIKSFADQAVIAIENVRLFNETKEALERQTATAEILKVIAGSPSDVQPVFDAMCASAARLCDAYDTAIWRVDGDVLRVGGHHGSIQVVDLPMVRGVPIGWAAVEREVIHVLDVQSAEREFPETGEIARRLGVRTVLGVPLLREGKAIGVIAARRSEARYFTERQIELLRTFADQAVIAIENVRLFNETKEALEQQTAISEVLRVISSSPADVRPILEEVTSRAAKICDAQDAHIFLAAGDRLLHSAGFGDVPLTFPSIPLVRTSVVGRAILDGASVHVADIAAEPEDEFRVSREIAARSGWRSALGVPLMREQRALGAILLRRKEVRPFSDKQISLLKTFADQAAIAIENVRLFNETKEALERQTATGEILSSISGSITDTKPVFDTIVRNLLRLFDTNYAAVFVPREGQVRLAALQGEPGFERMAEIYPLPLNAQVAVGKAMLERRWFQYAPISGNPAVPPSSAEMARRFGYDALIVAPMISAGKVVGAIATSRRTGTPFDDRQVALIKSFADQAAIAVENVRLFNETTEALERQTATADILKVIASSPSDVQPVFDIISRNALELCGSLYAIVQRFDGELMHFASSHLVAPEQLELVARGYPRPPDNSRAGGRAILSKSVVRIEDTLADPQYDSPATVSGGWRRILAVPMLRDGDPLGAIVVGWAEPGSIAKLQEDLLQTFADQAVIAIENVRLFNETKEALERQTATAEVLKVIASSPSDVQPVFDAIVKSALALCKGLYANAFRYDGAMLHFMATATAADDPVVRDAIVEAMKAKYPMRPDDSQASGRVIRTGTIARIEDLARDPKYDRSVLKGEGPRRMLAVPMLREGSAAGVIVVAWSDPGPISVHHELLLKTFADQAVIAIENVRLFKELESRTEALSSSVSQLTALGEVGQAISSTLDLETVLKTIVTHAIRLTGLDGGSIYEYDEVGEVFRLQAADDLAPEFLEAIRASPIRKGDGTVGNTAVTLGPAQVPDIRDNSYQSTRKEVLIRAGYRAILTVPLLREDHVIGALSVIRKTPGPFAPEIVELLNTFATQSAMAIQNARLFREIAEKGRQLEEASKHKSQFLASMSHELRTPLNALLGFNEMILGEVYGPVSEDMQPPLAQMQTSGKHLLRLINNVLDLAKIEAGRMELALSDYSVHDTVEAVRSTLRPLAAEKGIELLATVPGDIPLAYGDSGRITQCLMNLAGNSLKFTKVGKVEISVAESGKKLTYRVADTGVGIPPDKMESLFTEFKQTDATIASEYGGTGLGLSISKKFVEMHGGRIWVESIPGQGSTFSFEIPLRAGEGKEA
jgi:GAF domain-containing protein